jgi:hypothetical protein
MPTARPRARGALARRHRPTPPTISARRLPPEALTAAEVLALLDACGSGRPAAIRNRACWPSCTGAGPGSTRRWSCGRRTWTATPAPSASCAARAAACGQTGLDEGALALLDGWLAVRAS